MAKAVIDPGMLRHRLKLQSPSDESDGQGGITRSWTEVGTLWAAIERRQQSAGELASAMHVTQVLEIFIYQRADVQTGMRFVQKDGRIFTILSVRSDEVPDGFCLCTCEEAL